MMFGFVGEIRVGKDLGDLFLFGGEGFELGDATGLD